MWSEGTTYCMFDCWKQIESRVYLPLLFVHLQAGEASGDGGQGLQHIQRRHDHQRVCHVLLPHLHTGPTHLLGPSEQLLKGQCAPQLYNNGGWSSSHVCPYCMASAQVPDAVSDR